MRHLPLFALAVLLLTGCSTTFNREYEAALARPIPAANISGPWEGSWVSDKNGHTGNLRAVIRQSTANEYEAYFHATYWKFFRASYRVPLKFEDQGARVALSGRQDLGFFSGGVYTYEGEATSDSFFCTYKSKYDFGTFEMKRPPVSSTSGSTSPKE